MRAGNDGTNVPSCLGFGEPSVQMPVMDPSLEAFLIRNDSDDEQPYRSNDVSGLGQENSDQLRKRLGLFDPEDEENVGTTSTVSHKYK